MRTRAPRSSGGGPPSGVSPGGIAWVSGWVGWRFISCSVSAPVGSVNSLGSCLTHHWQLGGRRDLRPPPLQVPPDRAKGSVPSKGDVADRALTSEQRRFAPPPMCDEVITISDLGAHDGRNTHLLTMSSTSP